MNGDDGIERNEFFYSRKALSPVGHRSQRKEASTGLSPLNRLGSDHGYSCGGPLRTYVKDLLESTEWFPIMHIMKAN